MNTMSQSEDRIILGIDPGTSIMGYGLIRIVKDEMCLITFDVLHLRKTDDYHIKLKKIFETTLFLIDRYKPHNLAIEAPFYGKNIQSMLKLGRAQGVAIAAAIFRNIPVTEYSPRKIKQSITGNGNASKEQIAAMLSTLLRIDPGHQGLKQLDATDGLAAAVCHHFQSSRLNRDVAGHKSYSNWKAFLADNPERKVQN